MADFTPHEAPAKSVEALPVAPPSKLIGRDVTLGRIYSQLREYRPVLLYGPSGIGKSALAATLSGYYTELPGGVLYFQVHNDTVSELIARVGRSYQENSLANAESPLALSGQAAALLGREKPLVVLDGVLNAQAATEFVERCGRDIPLLLVNENEIAGPWQSQRLGKLEPQQALALFKQVLGVTGDTVDADIERLAETLGNMPLALVIGASWARANQQSPAAFSALLPQTVNADVSPALVALTGAFRSLTGGANNALQGLLLVMGATFTGSASAEMMAMIAGAPVDAINNAFKLLVQRGLVIRGERYGQPYYSLHETTYTFLQTWLKGTRGLDQLQNKVRDAVRIYARKYSDAARASSDQGDAYDRLAAEMDLMLATAQWSAARDDRDLANQLSASLATAGAFVSERGYGYDVQLLRRLSATSTSAFPAYSEAAPRPVAAALLEDSDEDDEPDEDEADVLPAAVDADDELAEAVDLDDEDDEEGITILAPSDEDEDDDALEADALEVLPFDDVSDTSQQQRKAVMLAKQSGDRRQQAEQLSALAQTQERDGKDTEAIASLTEALALYEGLNDTPGTLSTLTALAKLTVKTENAQAAVLHASRGVALAREIGSDSALIGLLLALGDARQQLGESDEAVAAYDEALNQAQMSGDPALEGQVELKLGYAQLDAGDPNEALLTWEHALTGFRARGARAQEGLALGGMGSASSDLEHWSEAIGYFGSAVHIAREVGNKREEALQLNNLADAHVRAGQLGQAVLRYRQALHLAFLANDRDAIIATTVDLGRLLVESPKHLSIVELLVDTALALDGHDRDLRRLKERVEDEREALGDSVAYKPVAGTAQDYAANAYTLD